MNKSVLTIGITTLLCLSTCQVFADDTGKTMSHPETVIRAQAELSINDSSVGYQRALSVAEVIDFIIRSARSQYTQMVVGKLKKDGTGADVNHLDLVGYAPLPAQYIRSIAFDAAVRAKKEGNHKFDFFLRSLWNLNSEQHLQDDFEKEGWKFLVNQQKEHLIQEKSLKDLKWKPYTRIVMMNGTPTLRYLSADPASKVSCVTCHNIWEQKPEIKELRAAQGIEAGKVFQRHELMGALSINVPLETDGGS